MADSHSNEIRAIENGLQQAVKDCNDRCLYHGAKWAAELLNSLPEDPNTDFDGDLDIEDEASEAHLIDAYEARLQRREQRKFLMAKSFFDCKEFDRCAVTLLPTLLPQQPVKREIPVAQVSATPSKAKSKPPVSPMASNLHKTEVPELSQRSLFLALYARYLAGEKRKEEDSEMILGPSDGPVTANKELVALSGILEDYFRDRDAAKTIKRQSDGFLEYLYGIILIKGRNQDPARQWLLRSVKAYTWNWSAWQELAGLITSVEMLAELCQQLTPSVPAFLFQVYCSQELYQSTDTLHDTITQLTRFFPTSAFLSTQRALAFYHAKEYDSAASIFSSLLSTNPYRLDSMDVYSNILYVMDSARPKLSYLASLASATDRFRPETCCIIGNHYSKSSEHEKAVVYFRRALTLDRSFLSAWTLMGHEYIELKNTQAAIESYRRAVDANANDYRAWHGLGLGYELLDMHSYALHYYSRAAALQPWDPKMWAAVAAATEKCGKPEQAIRAYKRALAASDDAPLPSGVGQVGADADPLAAAVGGRLDPDLLCQIAVLYEGLGDVEEAAAYMELCLAQEEGADEEDGGTPGAGTGVTQTTSRARLWLAKWAMARGEWARCMELANELCQDGFEVEEAKGLIKDVRGRMGEGEA
ncbi:TPR-like protein [Myriangium duriaei CBS 260.36]|uniref:TPR-like protein n=1 Tax=Myriangium duriaei CBS 260.36 TaxID=1168546 RepID=A0A9P4MGC1_9PEZI|nr:TPR-like protein [Myriangium duriaei CBS 260.36]